MLLHCDTCMTPTIVRWSVKECRPVDLPINQRIGSAECTVCHACFIVRVERVVESNLSVEDLETRINKGR
jgi:hypothetical protein